MVGLLQLNYIKSAVEDGINYKTYHDLSPALQPQYVAIVIGSDRNGYSCSLQALLSSERPITSQSIPHLISWTSLPRLPVIGSTAATLSGQLVIIGGARWFLVKTIHQLFNGRWVKIGSVPYGRYWCLVVSPSPDKMMIVGGRGGIVRFGYLENVGVSIDVHVHVYYQRVGSQTLYVGMTQILMCLS